LAARVKTPARHQRITVIAPRRIGPSVQDKLVELGAGGYSVVPYHAFPGGEVAGGNGFDREYCRMETIVADAVADDLLHFLRDLQEHPHQFRIYLEQVEPCTLNGYLEPELERAAH